MPPKKCGTTVTASGKPCGLPAATCRFHALRRSAKPLPSITIPIEITEENYKTFNYEDYDWLIAVAVRRQLHKVASDDDFSGSVRSDLELDEFTELRSDPMTRAQTFSLRLGGTRQFTGEMNDGLGAFDSVLKTYPDKVRRFFSIVQGYLHDLDIMEDIFDIEDLDWNPDIRFGVVLPQIAKEIDRVLSEFIIYLYLLPDGGIRYGFDQVV